MKPRPDRTFGFEHLGECELAYLAGFIDGEGYIGVNRVRNPAAINGINWQVRMTITNTNLAVMEYVCGLLGRPVYASKPPQANRRWQYRVGLTGARAFAFLLRIREHLIVKRADADLVLQMPAYGNPLNKLKRLGRKGIGRGGSSARTSEQVAECERIWLEIKARHGFRWDRGQGKGRSAA